jgi:hypothetical protein
VSVSLPEVAGVVEAQPELRALFHRLYDQLGIILAQAEILEAEAIDDRTRARAESVVASAVDAVGTIREIRSRTAITEF